MMNDERQKAVEKLVAEKLKRDLQPVRQPADCPGAGLLAAYVDRTLRRGERVNLETHLASCRGCQAAIAMLVKLSEGDEPSRLAPPARRSAFGAWRWAWAAPLLVAVVIVGVWRLGNFRKRAAEPNIEQVMRIPLEAPPPPKTPGADEGNSPPTVINRPEHLPKPLAKPAESTGLRQDFSKEKSANVKTEGAPASTPAPEVATSAAPPPPVTAMDKVVTTGGLATPSERAKLVAPAQGTGQGAGVGGVASGTANDVETTQAKTRDEKSEPMAAELEERKARVEKGALAKKDNLTSTTQSVTVTSAAPTLELDTGLANKQQAGGWNVVRTRKAGTWRVGPGGAIERLRKLGRWATRPSGVTVGLYNLAFFNTSEGWIVGQTGAVLHTADGGKTWSAVTSPTASDLVQVTATGKSSAQVNARDGSAFTTTDGGKTWNSLPRP